MARALAGTQCKPKKTVKKSLKSSTAIAAVTDRSSIFLITSAEGSEVGVRKRNNLL